MYRYSIYCISTCFPSILGDSYAPVFENHPSTLWVKETFKPKNIGSGST